MNRSLLAIFCSFAILPTAEAGFLAVRVTDFDSNGHSVSVKLDGTTYNPWAGTITARYTATTVQPSDTNPSVDGIQPPSDWFNQPNLLSVYCVNLREQWRSNPFAYETTPYGIQAGGNVLNGNSALVAALIHSAAATVSTAAQRAGLQLALWEATYDGWAGGTTLNAAGGKFSVTSASSEALSAAVGYLNTAQSGAAVWFKPAATGGGEQDMVGLVPNPSNLPGFGGNITPAPVPPTAGLALLGGLTAFAGRRLRRRA